MIANNYGAYLENGMVLTAERDNWGYGNDRTDDYDVYGYNDDPYDDYLDHYLDDGELPF